MDWFCFACSLLPFVARHVDGRTPASGLIKGIDGDFYGTTHVAGAFDFGSIYKISPTGNFSVLSFFPPTPKEQQKIIISFVPAPGKWHQVEFKRDLNEVEWSALGERILSSSSKVKITNSLAAGSQ